MLSSLMKKLDDSWWLLIRRGCCCRRCYLLRLQLLLVAFEICGGLLSALVHTFVELTLLDNLQLIAVIAAIRRSCHGLSSLLLKEVQVLVKAVPH